MEAIGLAEYAPAELQHLLDVDEVVNGSYRFSKDAFMATTQGLLGNVLGNGNLNITLVQEVKAESADPELITGTFPYLNSVTLKCS